VLENSVNVLKSSISFLAKLPDFNMDVWHENLVEAGS